MGLRLGAAEPRTTIPLGSAEKTPHANPGGHFRVPSSGIDSSTRFSARHPGGPGDASGP